MGMEAAEQELWRRYRLRQDLEARDFLILRYSPWAKSVAASVARRIRHNILEWSDHVQNAQVGLLEAITRYEIERGVDFMAYAKPRVRGAVFNGMRAFTRNDFASNRSHMTLERLESIQADFGDDPLAGFIDTVLGFTIGHFLEVGDPQDDGIDSNSGSELTSILHDALLELPIRQREILIAHYLRQVPFQEIAKGLGLTKGRVSQIHKAALIQIRHIMRDRRYDRDSFF
jgi:RNA polymerase sigma factor FliA